MEPAGLYIHIPFCIKKCPYCDFYSIADNNCIPLFIDALILEIKLIGQSCKNIFDTIHFGGGTPSLLEPEQIELILKAAANAFNIKADAEITMETNPGTTTLGTYQGYNNAGINRITIGVQSFNDRNLEFLGRSHDANEAEHAILSARKAGFNNLGIDLIYGLPGQTPAQWQIDLNKVISFHPGHISCYLLTYEYGTPMERDKQEGKFKPLDDLEIKVLFESTTTTLESNGYRSYEISNFSSSSKTRSRHNLKYWTGAPYIGVGPAAHSFDGSNRSWNKADINDYIADLGKRFLPVDDIEALTREQQMIESIYLGLRLSGGINIKHFNETFNLNFQQKFAGVIEHLFIKGLLDVNDNFCSLTSKGKILQNSVTELFVDEC
ncbi:MAG: radical SAM family heme chaperone HemW [Desulfobacterales bacterium]|nr:radical SAM family heme chaperone HemW [Desulfobacterales bacterium]